MANAFPQVLCIRADVTKEADVERAVDEAVKEFGRIDYAASVLFTTHWLIGTRRR